MSFILDALRKSEKERQQTAVPGISDVPAVVHATRVPSWVIGVIVLLSVGVLGLGWAWWQSSRDGPAATADARPVAPQRSPQPEEVEAGTVRNLAREVSAGNEAPADVSTPGAADPVAATRADPPAVEAETPTVVVGPPTMMELLAAGTALPQLMLELHVFSSSPSERFVRINSASYREGDVLNDGPRVVEITSEGVILDYRDQNFLLSAE